MTTTQGPIVPTTRGRLRGRDESGVAVFRGAPFARPPVGALRFRAPEPADGWTGERDAGAFGPASYQANRPIAPILGMILPDQSEDCLTLNVWTPARSAHDGAKRPVLVFVHGGAWVIGSGQESTYDGSSLARRGDVVVVTINYRLGPFGFLASPELGATGNEGLLDIMAALEWVRDEIEAFGGDPRNVTLFGESAGSVNVACLLASTRTKGLFHKAILESGAPNLLRSPYAAATTTTDLLKQLGLGAGDVAKLRQLPATELLAAANSIAGKTLLPPFAPVADGLLVAEKPFAAIGAGSGRGIPLLTGTNADEMKLYAVLDPTLDAMDEAALLARVSAVLPAEKAKGIVETYRSERARRGDDVSPVETWFAIATDAFFRGAVTRLAELHARATPDVFVYEFTWKATTPGKPQGAVHSLELPFVFGTLDTSEIGAFAGRTPAARELSLVIQDAWIAFARTGRPRSTMLPDWPTYAAPRRATMELGERSRIVEAPRETERAIWDALVG